MGQPAHKVMTARDAIDRAFDEFRQLFAESALQNILLEAVEYDPSVDEWFVTIGFDAGRTKIDNSPLFGASKIMIREARKIVIRGVDGEFVRMNAA